MKKQSGFSVAGVVVGVLAAALIVVAAIAVIQGNNNATDFSKYDFYSVIGPDNSNGDIGDHVKGSADAPVLIFEYADYQCPGCASMNPRVNKLVEERDGKLGVVYRDYLLSYHKNGTAAASAVEAAGLQGYWKEYADKVFAEQTEWEDASASERSTYFDKYFEEVTEGKGDMDRFHEDIASDRVAKKIAFDGGIGKRVNVESTPAFFIDGQPIKWGEAGSVVVNGKEVKWDSAQSGDKFTKLIKEIVATKLGEDQEED